MAVTERSMLGVKQTQPKHSTRAWLWQSARCWVSNKRSPNTAHGHGCDRALDAGCQTNAAQTQHTGMAVTERSMLGVKQTQPKHSTRSWLWQSARCWVSNKRSPNTAHGHGCDRALDAGCQTNGAQTQHTGMAVTERSMLGVKQTQPKHSTRAWLWQSARCWVSNKRSPNIAHGHGCDRALDAGCQTNAAQTQHTVMAVTERSMLQLYTGWKCIHAGNHCSSMFSMGVVLLPDYCGL